jgi:hypothetical protein
LLFFWTAGLAPALFCRSPGKPKDDKAAEERRSPNPRDQPRAIRAVEMLQVIATSQARNMLETLATGFPEARLTQEAKAALIRLKARDTK